MLHVSEQHHFQGGNGQASKAGSGHPPADPSFNLPVRVLGWDGDAGAKVELLEDVAGFRAGSVLRASVRTVSLGRQPNDFSHLKKAGLRTGGFVLMRKVAHESDGSISARSIETLLDRETDGLASVLHGAAVCIMPSPAGTAMVNECLVALANDAAMITSVEEALAKVASATELACTFGRAGMMLTGTDGAGDAVEVMVGTDRRTSAADLAERFLKECPTGALSAAEVSPHAWWLVPIFRAEVDIDRSSKLSAQRANHDYGSPEQPLWSVTNAFMRTFAQDWLLADASPVAEGPSPVTGVLIDLIER